MITREEAYRLVEEKLPKSMTIRFSVEDDDIYEFYASEEQKTPTYIPNEVYCDVHKDTGLVEVGALIPVSRLFFPEKLSKIKSTLINYDSHV